MNHQYIDRRTRQVCNERLYGDLFVRALYSSSIERPNLVTSAASSQLTSNMLSMLSYNTLMAGKWTGLFKFVRECGIDLTECVDALETLDTAKKVFERQIRFWDFRPMPDDPSSAVCPVDARVIIGSLRETSSVFIKEKFFDFEELLGADRANWLEAFANGDFAIFRLTPEKYHYVHVPAAGKVLDFYEIDGRYHSCNPQVTVSLMTPYSKNRRVVTIVQTDSAGGSHIGLVAIIEVVALMVGRVVQRYSDDRYELPRPILPDLFLKRGQPKSLFLPGSSTVILLFQEGRVEFAADLIANRFRHDVTSRFSLGFNQSIVETDVAVRSLLASPKTKREKHDEFHFPDGPYRAL